MAKTPFQTFRCLDCTEQVLEWYMVKSEVWKQAVPNEGELREALKGKLPEGERVRILLHYDCLEKRIGRSLVIGDFQDLPINLDLMRGYQIAKKEQADAERDRQDDARGDALDRGA